MGADQHSLGTVAQDLLDAVVAGYAEHEHPPPGRRLIVVGGLTMDACEQLAVSLDRLYPATAFAEVLDVINCSTTFTADFSVTVTRCLPQPSNARQAPSADALTAAAKTLARDGLVIARTIVHRAQAKTLIPSLDEPSISLGPLEPVEKQGGYHGWSQLVRVAII